jgi:hypothetical protein
VKQRRVAELTPAQRTQARRVFEETLRSFQQRYKPAEPGILDATLTDADGTVHLIARYAVATDGTITRLVVPGLEDEEPS